MYKPRLPKAHFDMDANRLYTNSTETTPAHTIPGMYNDRRTDASISLDQALYPPLGQLQDQEIQKLTDEIMKQFDLEAAAAPKYDNVATSEEDEEEPSGELQGLYPDELGHMKDEQLKTLVSNERSPLRRIQFEPKETERFIQTSYRLDAAALLNPETLPSAIYQMNAESTLRLAKQIYDAEKVKAGTGQLGKITHVMIRLVDKSKENRLYTRPFFLTTKLLESKADDYIKLASAGAIATLLQQNNDDINSIGRYGDEVEANKTNLSFIPQNITIFYENPNRVVPKPKTVGAYTKEIEAEIRKITKAKFEGRTPRDLDRIREGQCLIDTVASLSGVDREALYIELGRPEPDSTEIGNHLEKLAALVGMRFRILTIDARDNTKLSQMHITNNISTVTHDLLLVTVAVPGTKKNPAPVIQRHILYLPKNNTAPIKQNKEKIYVQMDLETVPDFHTGENKAYAVNLLAYRVPNGIETTLPYDPGNFTALIEFLDTDCGTWVKPLIRSPEGAITTAPDIERFAKVYLSGDLDVFPYMTDFINKVIAQSGYEASDIVLVGFNNAKFDNLILARWLLNNKITNPNTSYKVFGTMLLNMQFSLPNNDNTTVTAFDIRRHLVGSLSSCCSAWGVPVKASKLSLNHTLVHTIYNMNPTGKDIVVVDDTKTPTVQSSIPSFDNFLKANGKEIINYCRMDVVSCAILHSIYKTAMEFIVNKHLINKYNASMALANKINKPRVVPVEVELNKIRSAKTEEFIKTVTEGKPEIEPTALPDKTKRRIVLSLKDLEGVAISKDVMILARLLNILAAKHSKPGLYNNLQKYDASREELLLKLQEVTAKANDPDSIDDAIWIATKLPSLAKILPSSPGANKLQEIQAMLGLDKKGRIPLDIASKLSLDDKIVLIITKTIWDKCGGSLYGARIKPNIEEYPTLAGFAEALRTLLFKVNGIKAIGGFDANTANLLRKHLCIAGRSEAKRGIYEDRPYMFLDIVSLYPTAMTAGLCGYGHSKSSGYYVWPKDGYSEVNQAGIDTKALGIWKVEIFTQPNGIVCPARTTSGIHWDQADDRHMFKLVCSQDLDSLKLTGAKYRILEGISLDDTSPVLYEEYISIFRDEKTRQDQLKTGSGTRLFPNEQYNSGIREACKLGMNILSGKELMKVRHKSKIITQDPEDQLVQDTVNRSYQTDLLIRASRFLREQSGHVKNNGIQEAADQACLSGVYHTLLTEAAGVNRLVNSPDQIGVCSYRATWQAMPEKIKHSHLNGYHIYATARQIMNRIYNTVGFNEHVVTETDSLAIPVSTIGRLASLTTHAGDPLVYANEEVRLGILQDMPLSTKAKQFGQLEIETTEKLVQVVAKELGVDPKTISKITWEGTKIFGNGNETTLHGPFMAIGGKKIYLQYLKRTTGEIIPLKVRFKGVSIGRDQLVTEEIYNKIKQMSPPERVRSYVNEYQYLTSPVTHEAVIHMASKDTPLFISQYRVSENNTSTLTSSANFLIRKMVPKAAIGLTDKQQQEIDRDSSIISILPLMKLKRTMFGSGGNMINCDWCIKTLTYVKGGYQACNDHIQNITISCHVCLGQKEPTKDNRLCRLHQMAQATNIGIDRLMNITYDRCGFCPAVICQRALDIKAALCSIHHSQLLATSGTAKCSYIVTRKNRKIACNEDASELSLVVSTKEPLCRQHLHKTIEIKDMSKLISVRVEDKRPSTDGNTPISEPTRTLPVEQPANTGTIEQPAKALPVEQPANTLSIEQPTNTRPVEQPAKTLMVEQPAKTLLVEQQDKTLSIEQPQVTKRYSVGDTCQFKYQKANKHCKHAIDQRAFDDRYYLCKQHHTELKRIFAGNRGNSRMSPALVALNKEKSF